MYLLLWGEKMEKLSEVVKKCKNQEKIGEKAMKNDPWYFITGNL